MIGHATLVDAYLAPEQRDCVLRHRFSSDGRFLAALVSTYQHVDNASALEERIQLYQTQPFTLLATIRLPLDNRWEALKDLAFSPDERYLVLAGADGQQFEDEGTLWFWGTVAREFVASAPVHADPGDNQVWSITAVDWSGQGTLIATAGWEPSERGEMTVYEFVATQLVVKLWHVEVEPDRDMTL